MGSAFLAPLTTSICDQVARALQFLESIDIPHGYVAAANVLVVSSNEAELVLPSSSENFYPDIRVKLGDPGDFCSRFLPLPHA